MSLPDSLQTVCGFMQNYVNKTYKGEALEFKIFQCSKAMTRVLSGHKFRLYQFVVKALNDDASPSQPLDEQYRTYCNCVAICDATGSPAVDKTITAAGYLEDIQNMIQIVCSPSLLKCQPLFSADNDKCLRVKELNSTDSIAITLYQEPIAVFTSQVTSGPVYASIIAQNLHIPKTIFDTPSQSFNEVYIPVMSQCSTPYACSSMPWCFATAMLSIINENRAQDSTKAVRVESFVKLIYRSVWGIREELNSNNVLRYKTYNDIPERCKKFREDAEKKFNFRFEDSETSNGSEDNTEDIIEKQFRAEDALEPYKYLFSTEGDTDGLENNSNMQSMVTNLFNLWNYTGSNVNANNTKLYNYIKSKIDSGYRDLVCISSVEIGSNNNEESNTTDSKHVVVIFDVDDNDNSIWAADSRIEYSERGQPEYIVAKTISTTSTIPFILACTAFDYVYEILIQSFFKHKETNSLANSDSPPEDQLEFSGSTTEVPETFVQVSNELIATYQMLSYNGSINAPFQSSIETNSLGYAIALAINFLEKSEHVFDANIGDNMYSTEQKRMFMTHLISPDDVKDLFDMNCAVSSERDITRYIQYIFQMKGYKATYSSMNINLGTVLKQYLTEKLIKNQAVGYKLRDVHSCCLLIYHKYTVVIRNGQESPGTIIGVQAFFVAGYDQNNFKAYTYNKDGTVRSVDIPISEAYRHKISLPNDDGTSSDYFLNSGYIITGLGYSKDEYSCDSVDTGIL